MARRCLLRGGSGAARRLCSSSSLPSPPPVTHIYRFADTQGAIHQGTYYEPEPGSTSGGGTATNTATAVTLESIAAGKPDERVEVGKLLAPVTPPAIMCIGLNYRRHAAEVGMDLPRFPVLFMKAPGSVVGDGAHIVIPDCVSQSDPGELDYECELAVVIGEPAKDVPPERALDHVWGYAVANDVSARRWQGKKGGGQWCRAKSFDTFCPFGPGLALAEAVPDPQALRLTTTLNGQMVQDSNTSDMIFSVAEIISFLSQGTTLHSGTVILTGTPEGVGMSRDPPLFMAPGDEITCTIEGVGSITNKVVAA
eukprot:g1868.t1